MLDLFIQIGWGRVNNYFYEIPSEPLAAQERGIDADRIPSPPVPISNPWVVPLWSVGRTNMPH